MKVLPDRKTCTICKVEKPISEYRWDNKAKNYKKARCAECENRRMREDRIKNGEKRRQLDREMYSRKREHYYVYNRKKFFNLTDEEIKRVQSVKNCQICGKTSQRKLVVDHCHATNKNRGVICNQCNLALGHFKDDIDVMRRALEYLINGGTGFFEEKHETVIEQT